MRDMQRIETLQQVVGPGEEGGNTLAHLIDHTVSLLRHLRRDNRTPERFTTGRRPL